MKSNIQADLFGQEQEADDITERSRVKCIRQLERLKVSTLTKNFTTILLGMEWTSLNCKLVWTFKGTKYGRFYCQLRPLTLPTEGTEYGLLPTPRTVDVEGGIVKNVPMAMGMIPTPQSRDWKGCEGRRGDVPSYIQDTMKIGDGKPSQLSPQFVMEMMGFPIDWTLLPFLNGEMNQSRREVTQ